MYQEVKLELSSVKERETCDDGYWESFDCEQ